MTISDQSSYGAASPRHLKAKIFHGRTGVVKNKFTYSADYVAIPIDPRGGTLPFGFSRNRFNFWSINDRDFGNGVSSLSDYVQTLVQRCEIAPEDTASVTLVAMPRSVFYSFNPISFWLFSNAREDLKAVVVEVSNVNRDRHSYLCKKPNFETLTKKDHVSVSKALYVSPFQSLEGEYTFQFDLSANHFGVKIKHDNPHGDGLVATLQGDFLPLTTRSIIASALARPFGALRVMGLIYWQALRLKIKGAQYLKRPNPPEQELSV